MRVAISEVNGKFLSIFQNKKASGATSFLHTSGVLPKRVKQLPKSDKKLDSVKWLSADVKVIEY